MNNDTEISILYKTIVEYLGPIIDQTGYKITTDGFLQKPNENLKEGYERIMYQNPKYVQGTMDPTIPPVLIPKIPITNRDYLNIKLTPNYDLFSPFTYFKHMAIIMLKFKDSLAPLLVNGTDDCHCEEDFDKFKDCITIGDKINEKGLSQIDLVSYEDPNNPVIIASYSSDDVVKSMFGLMVTLYIDYIIPGKPVPTKYKNIDRTWAHIKREMAKWDKDRIAVSQLQKAENSMNYSSPETDLSLAIKDSETTAEDIAIANFNQNYFVETDDCENPQDPKLQAYLLSLMYPEGIPYVKPDDEERINPVVEEAVLTPIEDEVVKINDDVAKETMKISMENERKIEEEKHCGSVFSMKKKPVDTSQPMQFNPYGFGGGFNPMMQQQYGMGMNQNPFVGYRKPNLPPASASEACLCNTIDPFANYR